MRTSSLYLLFALIIVSSCAQSSLCGSYHSVKPSYANYFVMRLRGFHTCTYSVSNSLNLNPDSSFRYTNCSNIMSGYWKQHNDSVFLYFKTNRWRIDSLNRYGFKGEFTKVPSKPYMYQIKHNSLLSTHVYNNKYFIERMSKQ